MSENSESQSNLPASEEPAELRIAVFSVPDDPEPLELAMMALPDMDRATAKFQSRLLPGIIPYSYAQQPAMSVTNAIQELGLNAAAIPVSEIPDLMHVHQTHHVRLTDDGLNATDTSDNFYLHPWNTISVISVGTVPSSAPSRFHAPPALSSGSSHRLWNEGARTSAKPRPEVYVILSNDQPGLLLASDEMNYEYLGDRLSTSSGANFRLMVVDLIGRAKDAWVTPSTLAFLEHSRIPKNEFRSREEFRRYTEFQCLLSQRHRRDP